MVETDAAGATRHQEQQTAGGLAVFSIASAVLFHGGADQMQQIMFMKNLAIAGGLLFLVARGAGRISLDHKFFSRA